MTVQEELNEIIEAAISESELKNGDLSDRPAIMNNARIEFIMGKLQSFQDRLDDFDKHINRRLP